LKSLNSESNEYCLDPSFKLEAKQNIDSIEILEYERERFKRSMTCHAGAFPLQLQVELNDTCNLRCIMCPQRQSEFSKGEELTLDAFKKIIDEGMQKGLQSLKLQYRGEPTLSKILIETIVYAKEKGVIKVMFNTNGLLVTPNLSRQLIKAGLDKIIFSVDSANEWTYQKIRKRSDFHVVRTNIISLNANRQALRKKNPIIRVQAVKQPLNAEEFEKDELDQCAYVEMWKNYGDEVGWEDEFDMFDNHEDYSILLDWHCDQLYNRLVILANGDVLPCCAGIDYKDNKKYVIGNIFKETIESIWNSKTMKTYRTLHENGYSHLIEMCRKCRLRKLVLKKMKEEE